MESKIIVRVDFYATVQSAFGTKSTRIDLAQPATVAQVIQKICTTERGRQKLIETSGDIRNDITILRNGRSIHFLDGVMTEVRDGDKIAIFPQVAGG